MQDLKKTLTKAFTRAVAGALYWANRLMPAEPECIVPLAEVKKYLRLEEPFFTQRLHFPIRIDYSMRVNLNNFRVRTQTMGFESRPTDQVRVRVPVENFIPGQDKLDHYIQIFHMSQAVVFTDYMRPSPNRGFAVMIYPRSPDPKADTYVAFGLYGHYDRKGNLAIRKIVMPMLDKDGHMTKPRRVTVTPDLLPMALTYAGLCAEQVYRRESLTPQRNLEVARMETARDNALPWKRQPQAESLQLRA